MEHPVKTLFSCSSDIQSSFILCSFSKPVLELKRNVEVNANYCKHMLQIIILLITFLCHLISISKNAGDQEEFFDPYLILSCYFAALFSRACSTANGWKLSLGCVIRAAAAKGGQDAGITQPRDHFLAGPCISFSNKSTFVICLASSKLIKQTI